MLNCEKRVLPMICLRVPRGGCRRGAERPGSIRVGGGAEVAEQKIRRKRARYYDDTLQPATACDRWQNALPQTKKCRAEATTTGRRSTADPQNPSQTAKGPSQRHRQQEGGDRRTLTAGNYRLSKS